MDRKEVSNLGEITNRVLPMYAEERPTYFAPRKVFVLGNGKRIGLYFTSANNVRDWDGLGTYFGIGYSLRLKRARCMMIVMLSAQIKKMKSAQPVDVAPEKGGSGS